MTAQQLALFDRLFEEACALSESGRLAWVAAHCSDPEVRAELESLLPHAAVTGGFTAVVEEAAAVAIGSQSSFAAGHTIGPYRIVGILGEGGMGAVYEAVRDDDQFRQTVAIKVLRMSARTEAARRRFLQERQILAELEHPNIARLLDGGAAADGSPYIVMERIDGQPLIAFATSRKLSVRQRLELFRQVANAVQYAHQKLIVHRDLKPGNILVTAEGSPKLLDFGIAKLLDAETAGAEALTATGLQLMTPDYASPEQVQGKPVTAASDVYSLGAVLYELLSGARPHGLKSYNPTEIAEKICLRDVAPPSSAGVAALRGDLDTIVLKAMQKVPERRYNSAEQFSEDVRRYLEGMPVLARPDTAGYRMRKFVGRHWVGLAATAAVVVALTAGVAVSLYQARLAGERFELVRRLANRFLFDFHNEIASVSGTTKAQQMVVNTAVEYLDKLSATAGSDRALLQDMAEAYSKLAGVQGRANTSNTGRRGDALMSQRRSVEFYRRLAAIDPAKRLGLARSLNDQARLEVGLAQSASSLEHSREGVRILDTLLASDPQNTKLLDECATGYLSLSRALVASDKLGEALPANLKGQEYMKRMMATDNSPGLKRRLAVIQQDEGEILVDGQGDVEKGVAIFERLRRTIEELVAADPRNRSYQRFLQNELSYLSVSYYSFEHLNADDAGKAAAVNEKRLEICRKLVNSDPADARARTDLAITESESATALMALDPRQAIELAASGLAHWDDLPKSAQADAFSTSRRALVARQLALALLLGGRPREAVQPSTEAAAAIRGLLAEYPNEPDHQARAVFAFTVWGRALAAGNRDPEARKAFEEAASLGEVLRAKEQSPLVYTVIATYAFDHFGDYWKSRNDRAQARRWFERSLQAWTARPERTPAVEQRRMQAEKRLHGLEP